MKKLLWMAVAAVTFLSCEREEKNVQTLSGLNTKDFVGKADGKATALYVLKNSSGAEACITNYGGRLVSLMVRDREGHLKDVVLGYGTIDDYLATNGNYGALIGRYGNRIKNGQFTLNNVTYNLEKNNNGNSLHGGPRGFHTQVWDAEQLDEQTLKLTYLSKDGEEGFPGNLGITVIYKLTDQNAIDIQYEATTDKTTVINLTNHSYFNLSGRLGSQILDHYIQINGDSITAVDETMIPNRMMPVEGTPFDLRVPMLIKEGINEDHEQLVLGKGYDHNWILNSRGDIRQLAARVYHDGTGIVMDVYTTEPGIQLYTGNFMTNDNKGKSGVTYPHRGALCLETQHFPDSPNQPGFPSVVLPPGKKYTSRCIYQFKVGTASSF